MENLVCYHYISCRFYLINKLSIYTYICFYHLIFAWGGDYTYSYVSEETCIYEKEEDAIDFMKIFKKVLSEVKRNG